MPDTYAPLCVGSRDELGRGSSESLYHGRSVIHPEILTPRVYRRCRYDWTAGSRVMCVRPASLEGMVRRGIRLRYRKFGPVNIFFFFSSEQKVQKVSEVNYQLKIRSLNITRDIAGTNQICHKLSGISALSIGDSSSSELV